MKKRIAVLFIILVSILSTSCSFFINPLVGIWYASETVTEDFMEVEMTMKTYIKMVFMVNKKFKATMNVETTINGEPVKELCLSDTQEGLFNVSGNKVTFTQGAVTTSGTFEISGDTLTLIQEDPDTGEQSTMILTRN